MIPPRIHRCLAIGVAAISLWIIPAVIAGEFRIPKSFYQSSPGRWLLNPAGQLQVWFDPLNNGRNEFEETYTVILNDRAPKMCGDPDGTGRYTWFFTDALLIDVVPVRSQATPNYPSSPEPSVTLDPN